MKSLKAGVIAVGLLASVTASQPSHAIIGVATVNPGLAIAGGIIAGAGALVPLTNWAVYGICGDLHDYECGTQAAWSFFATIPAGAALAIVGLVLLPDQESGGSVQLSALSARQRDGLLSLGLTPAQLDAFEDERQELESAAQDVGLALRARAERAVKDGVRVDDALVAKWGSEEWVQRKNAVSPQAFEAFSKIAVIGIHKTETGR